jgi:hypothetical protein
LYALFPQLQSAASCSTHVLRRRAATQPKDSGNHVSRERIIRAGRLRPTVCGVYLVSANVSAPSHECRRCLTTIHKVALPRDATGIAGARRARRGEFGEGGQCLFKPPEGPRLHRKRISASYRPATSRSDIQRLSLPISTRVFVMPNTYSPRTDIGRIRNSFPTTVENQSFTKQPGPAFA